MRAAGFAIASIFLAGAGSASAQVISNVLAAGVTSSSVTITWATNLPASSKVNYGLTTSYNLSSALDPVLTTTHSVTLYGLAANTLYNFNVVSTGSSNTTVSSANFRFATLSLSPIIADINTIWVTSTSVTVNWTTDQPSTGMVNYGPTSNYIFSTPLQSTPSIAHTVTLNGLSPNTTYNFAVVSSRLSDVPSTSANQTVTTAAATATAPSVGFTPAFGVGDASATLTWSTNVPANTVVAYGTTLALGQLAPVQTALSTSHQVVLTGLHAGTTYYFVDMSTGAGGATGYSPLLSFTTTGLASLVPVISNVASSNLSATSATITWNTGVPSTSQVHYGTTASYGFSSPLDSTLTTIHSVNLTGLSPSIRYVFQVVSASTGGVSMFGANMTGIKVWAWGDSLTLGYGDYLSQNTYPLYLSTAIGTPVANEAVGGWTSTQIAQLMLATPASFPVGNCNVIWSGGNNHNQVSQVLSDIASMVAALASPPCFLVLGVIQRATAPVGTPDYNSVYSINTSLAAQYGNNYLDISELLVQDYDPALALDVADYAKDVPPASLRAVQPMGTVTSGALDSVSCRFSVSNGTQGPGTAVIMDAETILVKAVSNNVLITDCTRGYNGTAAASHAANVTYSVIDQIHLGDKGYEFVALQVAAWFEARFPLSFSTPIANTPGPVIDAVTVSSVTSTSALVSWTTDQPATSLVNYGPTASYGLTSTLNPTLTTAHSVALTGLTPNSTYNFSVVSANSLGGSSASANATLTTSIAAAPAISGVTVATLTPTSATITWTTDQPATTEVAYGSTPSYGSISSGDGSLSTSHYLTLFGLTAGTSYNYEAMSTNATGASAVSQNFIFRTGTFPATPRLPVLAVNPAIPANLQITAFATGLNYPNGMYQLPDGSLLVATSNPANNVLYGFATSTLQVYRITTTNGAAGAPTLVFGGSAGPATGMAGVGPLVAIATGSNTGSQILILQADNQDTLTQLGSIVFTYPAGYWQHDTHAVALRGVPNQAGSYQLIFSVGSQANNVATPASAQVGTSGMISQNLAADSLYSVQFSVAGSTIAAAPAIQLANGLRNPFALGFAPNGDIYLGDNGQNIGLTNVATSADTFDVIPAGTTTVLNFGFPDTFPDPVTGLEVGPTTGVTLPLAAFTPLNGQNSPGVAGMALAPTSFPASLRNGVFLGFFGTGYGYGCFWDPVIYLDPLTGQYFHFIEGGQFGVGPLISMLSTESALYIADFGTTGAGGTIYAVNLAPAITSVTATAISTTTATITWTTDQASSTQVSYGTTTAYGSQSALASTPVTSHSVSLTGLTPLTTYNFAVVSTNGSGASSTAGNFTFATAAAPPLISGVTATSIAATSAVITWTTDQASSSQVSYGTTPAYGSQSTLVSALVTSHSVALTGLTPNTTYNYQVISANSSGTSSASTNYTFTTTSTSATPPYVGYLAFWGINNNGVTISWSTDVNSNTVVAYGTTSALGQIYTNTSAGSTSTTSHGAVLTGLTPGTKYYFVAQSTGANGATGYSATFSFTTTGVAVSFAPVISGISVSNITSTSVTITWSTDQPSWSQVNYGTTTNYGSSSPLNTNLVNSHSVTLASLVPGTTYDFDVTSANGSGLLTTSPNQTFSLPPSGQPSFHLSASSATAIAGSPASYIAYGDSITYGAEASSTATRYTNLIASDSSAALTNRGAGGAQACDTAQTIMSNDNPPGSQAPLQTIMIGTNDAYIKGTGSYESVYKSCHTASLAWLAIPSTQKTAAQSCARSGAWEADTTYPPGLAAKSYSPGAALSCSLISYGGPLYLWYRVTDTNVGAFSYSVDGGPAQPVNSFSSTPIATWGGGVDGVFVIRIPGLAAGSHTVQVTVTSSVVSILAVGSLNPLAQFGAPKAFVGGVIRRQYDADAASTAAYDADAVADVVLLSGDGLPVYFVPVRNYVDANTDMFDGLHPADLGHLHLRDAFESVSQFP